MAKGDGKEVNLEIKLIPHRAPESKRRVGKVDESKNGRYLRFENVVGLRILLLWLKMS
jgi:hypothetical protein